MKWAFAVLLVLASPIVNYADGSGDMHRPRCLMAGYADYQHGFCVRDDHGVLIEVKYERAVRGPLKRWAGPMTAERKS